jgi:putative transposase
VKYAFVQANRNQHSVARLCEVMEVSTSGFYDWRDRPDSPRLIENRRLLTQIRCFHRASREVYGSPRIHADLIENGESVGVNRVARLMRREGITSKVRKRFVITTNSKDTRERAPDKLERRFTVHKPNRTWVSDTTFIPTRHGWLYLAVVIDLYSRLVIGWAMRSHNDSQLVQEALAMALWRRKKAKGVIVHSDQGTTYGSKGYLNLLSESGNEGSMSRKGECLDNAVAESFFGTLKNELVHHEDYRTRHQARLSLFEYIEVFYNQRRRHSYLGYMAPTDFEEQNASQLNRP